MLICDFCSAPNPAWRYMAFDFVAFKTSLGDVKSDGDWAACGPCKELIAAGDRAGLAQRSQDALVVAYPGMVFDTSAFIAELHTQFFAQRFDAPAPIGASSAAVL